MQFTFNKVSKWETGKENISWQQFLNFCEFSQLNLRNILAGTFFSPTDALTSQTIIEIFVQQTSLSQVATHANVSIRQIQRWLSGDGQIRLVHFLSLLDMVPGALNAFVASIVDRPLRKDVSRTVQETSDRTEFRVKNPITSLIQIALSLPMFDPFHKECSKDLALLCDLSQEDLFKHLDMMISRGDLCYEGQTLKTGIGKEHQIMPSKAQLQKLQEFWTEWVAKNIYRLASFAEGSKESRFGFNVFACSAQCFTEIQAHTEDYCRKVSLSLRADTGKIPTNIGLTLYNLAHITKGRNKPK